MIRLIYNAIFLRIEVQRMVVNKAILKGKM